MATLISAIVADARKVLLETTANFWTDIELGDHCIKGIKDLWKAVIDLHQNHFSTIDITNMSLAASTGTISGVPADMFRILLIEPRDTSQAATARGVLFKPKKFNSDDFGNARTQPAVDAASGQTIFYDLVTQGPPVAATTIQIAPQLNSALLLRVQYVPILAAMTLASSNPIPGESDLALMAWTIAWARAKEREDRSPDPNHLSIYATEKQNLLTALTPRQEQEPEVVESLFGDY